MTSLLAPMASETRWNRLFAQLTEMVERAKDNAEACEGCGSTSDCEIWCPESRGAERAGTEFFDETRGVK